MAFLILGMADIVLFGIFVGLGFYYRRRPETHKRMMLLATLNLVPAAIVRLPLGPARIPFAVVTVAAFLAMGPVHDWRIQKCVYPLFMWGAVLTFISVPIRQLIGTTAWWHRIAAWLCA